MWVFTVDGFFSVVQADERSGQPPGMLMVRARMRSDLERFVSRVWEFGRSAESVVVSDLAVLETPGADYPYRVIVTPDEWARYLSGVVHRLDYRNFKDRVADLFGYARADLYGKVWGVLYRSEEWLAALEPTWWTE